MVQQNGELKATILNFTNRQKSLDTLLGSQKYVDDKSCIGLSDRSNTYSQNLDSFEDICVSKFKLLRNINVEYIYEKLKYLSIACPVKTNPKGHKVNCVPKTVSEALCFMSLKASMSRK